MDLLEKTPAAEAMAQLSLCFEASVHLESSSSGAGCDTEITLPSPVSVSIQPKGVVLSFPQDRFSSSTQNKLIQQILQLNRFF